MLRLTLLVLLPYAALSATIIDPKFSQLLGGSLDGEIRYTGADHRDGHWDCPWQIGTGGCHDGTFTCSCSNGGTAKFSIGCCYHFPKCGRMCHNWSCYRYRNCATCKSKVSEWDMNACNACKKGYVYERGLCDKDLNECNNRNGGCDQKCHNTYGSYYCTCHSGFSLNSDKHTCKRLSCNAISETTQVSVKATENWLFHSYAKFAAKDIAMTLDGPSIAECKASGTSTYWDQARPAAVDTCSKVAAGDRLQCPATPDDISREACLQKGCCYHSVAGSPTCYLNPTGSYIKYGGTGPVASEEKGIKTYKNNNEKTCTHKCQNTHGPKTCKSFGIKHMGQNASQDVAFQNCHILTKTRAEYQAAGKLIKNPNYDIHESLTLLNKEEVTTFSDARAAGLSKQYVGCFKEVTSSPDLPYHVLSSSTHMEPAMCISLCRRQSHKFAGLQNGKDCYCGHHVYRRHGKSESCNIPCSGDASKMCGGVGANSLYSVAWTDSYLGCYKDDAANPDLPVKVWNKDAGRSARECMHECTKRNYAYAGLQEGGVCYCGNKYGAHGVANETACSSSCYGYARQNCGGVSVNAIYQTDIVNPIDSGSIRPTVTRLYDTSGSLSGVSTSMFTFYPGLRTILAKRLIIHSSTRVITPTEATCTTDCYTPCGNIYHDERISNKGSDVTLRFFYLNLSDLHKYVGTQAKRVSVYAQTVLIEKDIKTNFALSLRAERIIMDRSRAYYIEVPSDADVFDIDVEKEKFNDPESDTLHQKQIIMCARILLDTHNQNHISTAFSIFYDVAMTLSQKKEHQALATMARNGIAELAGLQREDVRFVPFYTKTHLAKILGNYYDRISMYKERLDKLVEGNHQKDQVVKFVEELHDIYSETDIYEANTAFEASVTAVKRSNATYQRFKEYYLESREALEKARVKFEDGLDEKKGWEIAKFLVKLIASVAKTVVGAFDKDKDGADSDEVDGIDIDIDGMFGMMQELSETIAQIDELSAVADQVVAEIENLQGDFHGIRYYDEVEMSIQLQVNIIKWRNLKNYGETLLKQEDIAAVRGCADYHRNLLDVCNWGEALTSSMVERAEMLRDSIEKRTLLDMKKEQEERISDHLEKYKKDLFSEELLIAAMVEQSYDVRLDLNEALLTFCQAYFYENMFECKPSYQPSFGGSLEDLLLKVNDAKRDDLLVGVAPSTIHRYIDITDTDTDPLCNDAVRCPINYLRKNRLLYFSLPHDHKDLTDIDAYKVSELILKFNGALPSPTNNYLKVQIESSGDFLGRANNQIHYFLTRALSLAFEYDLKTNHITVRADVYKEYKNIIQHITPFTTWVMRISDARSSDIDLSKVTSVRIQFNGSGVDNETWKAKRLAAYTQ